jgi:hypothetical protein
MAELQSLDINLLLLSHSSLAMITAALSVSPAWNLPLALYGLVVVANERNGDAIRQVSCTSRQGGREQLMTLLRCVL